MIHTNVRRITLVLIVGLVASGIGACSTSSNTDPAIDSITEHNIQLDQTVVQLQGQIATLTERLEHTPTPPPIPPPEVVIKEVIVEKEVFVEDLDKERALEEGHTALEATMKKLGDAEATIKELGENVDLLETESQSAEATIKKLEEKNAVLQGQVAAGSIPIAVLNPKPGNMTVNRTLSGSDECIPISSQNAFCIEILAFDVDDESLEKFYEGLDWATRLFPISRNELTTPIGIQDYIGISLWDPEISDVELLARDMCIFRLDLDDANSDNCDEVIKGAIVGFGPAA